MEIPSLDAVRAQIPELDKVEQKVLGGFLVLMVSNGPRVAQREWISENFTRLAVAALELRQEGDVDADLDKVKAFVQASMDRVLNIAYPLYKHLADEMAQQEGFSMEDACRRAMEYVGEGR